LAEPSPNVRFFHALTHPTRPGKMAFVLHFLIIGQAHGNSPRSQAVNEVINFQALKVDEI
jgi:hypothetical protein